MSKLCLFSLRDDPIYILLILLKQHTRAATSERRPRRLIFYLFYLFYLFISPFFLFSNSHLFSWVFFCACSVWDEMYECFIRLHHHGRVSTCMFNRTPGGFVCLGHCEPQINPWSWILFIVFQSRTAAEAGPQSWTAPLDIFVVRPKSCPFICVCAGIQHSTAFATPPKVGLCLLRGH